MNIKIFLNYLVHQKYLTPSQIKTTLPQTTEAKVLLNALVKQGYFSSEELKNHLKNFKEQQSPPSFRVSQEMKASLEEELLQEKQDPFSPLPSTQFLSKTAEELHCAPPVTATPVEQDFLETFQDLPPTQVSALQTLTLLDSMELIPQQEKLPTARHSTVFTSKKKIERYEVLETLGEGGMGVVQRVKDHLLGREVALKRIKFDEKGFNALSKRQQAMLWRLNREAYITSTLEHPHIVPLHEIQKEENGELYFTMRKVEGKTFATLLQETSQQQNYSEEERLSVFLKVCDAVAYSHSKSIVHRDLKPENIMVGKFGEVYVMDWGIAKILEESDPTLEDLEEIQKQLQPEEAEKYLTIGGMGTPGYMAPEQQENASQVDKTSDIYSLGKILRECFLLISPSEELRLQIEQERKKRKLTKYKIDYPEKENNQDKNIPPDIQAIVQKACHPQKEKRYRSVLEMVADLQRYRQHIRVSVRVYKPWELWGKWAKRNKIFLSILNLILLLCLCFWAYLQWMNHKEINETFKELTAQAYYAKSLGESAPNAGESIKHYLQALHFINQALNKNIPSEEASLRREKFYLTQQLIEWACQSKNYQLSYSLLNDLTSKTPEETRLKEKLETKTHTEQNRQLKEHQSRLQYWKQKLKEQNLDSRKKEDALFEISKMEEPEIFEDLLVQLEAGIHYFTKTSNRSQNEEDFYIYILKILGRLGNSKAKTPLFNGLKQIATPLKPHFQISLGEIHFMVALVEALATLQTKGIALEIQKIRVLSGVDSVFWSRTQSAYHDLLEQEEEEKPKNFVMPSNAIDYYNQGVQKKEQGQLEEALHFFNKALLVSPHFVEAYNNRGLIKKNQGHYESALDDFNCAIEYQPEFTSAYTNRANVLKDQGHFQRALLDLNFVLSKDPRDTYAYNIRAAVKQALGDFKGALEDYDKTLEIDPQWLAAYNNRGLLKKDLKDYSGALADFKQALVLDPESFDTYNNLGILQKIQGDLVGALASYDRSITLAPTFAGAYFNRALVLESQGDIQGALKDYQHAIQRDPQFLAAYFSRGNLWIQQKEWEKAWNDFERVIQINPKYVSGFYRRGDIRFSQNDSLAAITEYQKILQFQPEDLEAHLLIGECFLKLQDYPQSLTYYKKATLLAPQDYRAYHDAGMVSYFLKDYTTALTYLNKAVYLNPKLPQSYFHRAKVYEALNDFNSALPEYDQALTQDPRYIDAYHNRAVARQKTKNPQGALEDCNKALELDPQSFVLYLNRALIYSAQEDYEKAILDLNHTLQLNPQDPRAYFQLGLIAHYQEQANPAIDFFLQGLQRETHPQIAKLCADLLFKRAVTTYRNQQYLDVKKDLLLLQKYAPPDHPRREGLEKFLEELEEKIQNEKKQPK